jgi:hypothetical protein
MSLEKKRGSLTSKNTLESGNSQGQVNHCRENVRDPTGQPKGIFNGQITRTDGYPNWARHGDHRFAAAPGNCSIAARCMILASVFPISSIRAKEMQFPKRIEGSF